MQGGGCARDWTKDTDRSTSGRRHADDSKGRGSTKVKRSKGQKVRSRGTGRSGYVLDLSVRRRLELLSERFLAKAEPSYRSNLEAGDKVSAGLCLSPR